MPHQPQYAHFVPACDSKLPTKMHHRDNDAHEKMYEPVYPHPATPVAMLDTATVVSSRSKSIFCVGRSRWGGGGRGAVRRPAGLC